MKKEQVYTLHKGYPEFIAVKSTRAIHGYSVYYSRKDTEYKWHFKEMPADKVKRIEIYQGIKPNGHKKISSINESEKIQRFIQILKDSKDKLNFEVQVDDDTLYYSIVLYIGGAISYKYDLQFDGHTNLWHPWQTSILFNEFQEFITKQK